jgi:hypothetical protein
MPVTSFGLQNTVCPNIFLNSASNLDHKLKSRLILEIKKAIQGFFIQGKLDLVRFETFKKQIDMALGTTNDADFYWSISVAVNQLGNAHTFFAPPSHSNNFGLRYQNVDGKNFVTKVHPILSKRIHIGDEIVSVNSGTCLLGNLDYLNNARGSFVFKKPNGEVYQENLISEFPMVTEKTVFQIENAYILVKISDFMDQELGNEFYTQIKKLSDKKTIIFDLQGNPGGTLREVISIGKYFFGGEIGFYQGSIFGNKEIKIEKNNDLNEKIGKVFIIVDQESFSAAEIFTHLFKTRANAQVFGQPTRGGLENGLSVTMPDKSILSIANGEYCDRKVCFYGKKIEPDIVLPLGIPTQEIISTILKQP